MFKPRLFSLIIAFSLSACSLVKYPPIATIDHIQTDTGYRGFQAIQNSHHDKNIIIMSFSGGGTRAAALGYGVLETLNRYPVRLNGKTTTLVAAADMVYGVSGGSVLAAYYGLHGTDTLPSFEQKFLKQNLQRQIAKQSFSLINAPRLISPQFGRGDLLQEQLETMLFKNKTFADLDKRRKGPFAVISATDMVLGSRIDFVQEHFDVFCLDLSDMEIARAVAASSAVPFIFTPIVLNNHGGQCHYQSSIHLAEQQDNELNPQKNHFNQLIKKHIQQYSNGKAYPFIHLLDGGLTDNLGLRSILDLSRTSLLNSIEQQIKHQQIERIIIINVNAQNQPDSTVSQTANTPKMKDVAAAVINIPIDQNSQASLNSMHQFVQQWQTQYPNIAIHFISINLPDLPAGEFRQKMLNIPTSFYLPPQQVNDLKQSAQILLQQSKAFQTLMQEIQIHPSEHIAPKKDHHTPINYGQESKQPE